jgi:Leucine-rich repeat (LRR) protein
MKILLALFLFCAIFMNAFAQQNAASIKQQMSAIRKSTNWEDAAAAKKANEQIKELSKQLMMTGNPQGNQPPNQTKAEAGQAKKDATDEKMKMWGQVMKSAAGGKAADIFLAEPTREQIKQEYKEEESNKLKGKEVLAEMTFLCINMSSPTVQLLIDQMENYKSIKTLVITGGKNGSAVDLETLIAKAKNYPLQNLYIINFKSSVTKVPKTISNFQTLTFLALYNNKILRLPPELSSMVSLKKLYVDMNPVTLLMPTINLMTNLDTLGIAKTLIADAELSRIKQQLPNCKILLK